MAHTRLLDNLSGRVGDEILASMASATRTMMAVAFVKFSGVRLIEESLVDLLDRGGKAEIIFGLDFSLTEPRALSRVMEIRTSHPALTLFAFSDPYLPGREPTFHPKLYLFEQADGNWTAIVGSSNLSQGGLIDNIEISVAIDGPRTDPLIADVLAFYRSVRGRESLFVPTDDYLEVYRKVRSRIDRARRKGIKRRTVKEAVAQLRKLEERLPGTVPTQKELVIQAIKKKGVAEKDIVTDRYVIEPIYDDYNSLTIEGYRIYNMVAITLRDINKVNDVMIAALSAGANQVVNVEFYLSDLRQYRDQARDLAMVAAGEKAQDLAEAAGAEAGCVLNISENTWSYFSEGWWGRNNNLWTQNTVQNIPTANGQGGESEFGPVNLGQISVRAEVSASYSLK